MKNNPSKESWQRHHEAGDPALRNVFIIAVSVLLLVAISLAATKLLMTHFSENRPMHPNAELGILTATNNQPLARFPAPILETDDGHADQIALKSRQIAKLNSYGWVDRSHGIARIPITRAMDLILAQGFLEQTNAVNEARPLRLPPSGEAQP